MKIHRVGAELFRADRRTDRPDEAKESLFEILQTRLKRKCTVLKMVLYRNINVDGTYSSHYALKD